MARLAFVTTSPLPIGDDDRPLIDEAGARAGVRSEWPSWRDRGVDWSQFDAVVIRSTWDYHDALDEFLAWVERVDACGNLHNPGSIISWNAHKRYLLDLDRLGVPVVPTAVVRQAEPVSLSSVADGRGWRSLVVKPAVSAGAKGTGRFDADDPAGERALSQVLRTSDALVQPYLGEIEVTGETSIVVFGGEVAHAVGKVPTAGDFRVQSQHGGRERPVEPTDAERELATLAWATVESVGPLTYARVDCITLDGRPHLMEMEVIEPSLYLAFGPEKSADGFIEAVLIRSDERR